MHYLICEISGRQYLIKPGQTVGVDRLDDTKKLSSDKVLLRVDDGKVEIGKPYLKDQVDFEVVDTIKKPKIRVATYKAKANYRRVKGQRRQVTRIKLEETKKAVKKA